MKYEKMTMHEIRTKGLEALNEKLGPVGMIRFLQYYETGSGDYSQDRHRHLDDKSVDDIVKEIEE